MKEHLTCRNRLIILCIAAVSACALFMPSAALAVLPQFTVTGGGWGHGIGMSQWGARGYALKGWTYDDILAHYYQGTTLATKPTVTVKVNLDADKAARAAWLIQAGSSTTLTVTQASDPTIKSTLTKTGYYWITMSSGNTRVCKDVYNATTKTHTIGDRIKTFSGESVASAGGFVRIGTESGPYEYTGVIWRGTIHFVPYTTTTSKAINYVNIEKYLYGVVPRESPSSWPAEALKTQAVAARSYAYQDAKDGDVLWCTTMSQVYNGYARPGHAHEAASSNSAVDATNGKVVWYGSETSPVKTYFMSSSGGHTANIEDVWIGSTPKPYYKGVDDADQDSPNYSWTVGPYSATTVASLIRARDDDNGVLDYSVPSPATVTSISCEMATSGYAHHVNVTWSNGKTFRIYGTTFQRALSLKSTHFKVARSYPTETTRRYEDSSSRLAWFGRWSRIPTASASGGTLRSTATSNSAVTAAFSGTGVAWIGAKGPDRGTARVYVDGVFKKAVDLYASSPAYKQTLYANLNLTPGSHTLKVLVTHARNAKSAGYSVPFDALDVINGTLATATASLTRFEQDDSHIGTLGTWTTYAASPYSGGDVLRSTVAKSRLYATFYGSEVRWIGTRAATYGLARVSLDGAPSQVVTLTSSTTSYQQVLFKKTGLDQSKTHTLMVEAVGSGGTLHYIGVDAIDVRGGWFLPVEIPAVTVDQTTKAATWTGAWSTGTGSGFSGSSHAWSAEKNASCTFAFEGTSVSWIDKRGANYGKARVYLDGVDQGVVDQYAATTQMGQTLWSSKRLACAPHTLKIVALHEKRAASSGYRVGIDAFRVTGRSTP